MIKKCILFALFVSVSCSVFSQWDVDDDKTFKFGIGTALSLPIGDLKDATKFGVGVELGGFYTISDNLQAFAQAGVHVFKGSDDYYGDASSVLHIPAMVGARFKAGGFFAGAGAGYGFYNGGGDPLSGFLYSPQIGYEASRLQILAHYTSTSVTGGSLSYFGIKLFRTF